jgi:hypothetical protein
MRIWVRDRLPHDLDNPRPINSSVLPDFFGSSSSNPNHHSLLSPHCRATFRVDSTPIGAAPGSTAVDQPVSGFEASPERPSSLPSSNRRTPPSPTCCAPPPLPKVRGTGLFCHHEAIGANLIEIQALEPRPDKHWKLLPMAPPWNLPNAVCLIGSASTVHRAFHGQELDEENDLIFIKSGPPISSRAVEIRTQNTPTLGLISASHPAINGPYLMKTRRPCIPALWTQSIGM